MKKMLNIFLFIAPLLVLNAQKTNKVMDSLVAITIKTYNIPAISASLLLSDKAYYGVGGTTRMNGTQKVTLQSKFHLGSNTKAITAFIAMKLVEDATISLSTTIADVLSELCSEIRQEYHHVTLSDFLSHKAGIQPYVSGTDYLKLPMFTNDTSKSRFDFAKFVLNEASVAKGTYSNAGYVIAALLLENASKQSFEELLKTYMVALNLDYAIGFPNKESGNNPSGHWIEKGQWVTHTPNHPYKLADYMLPAGDVSMNIIDYSTFIQLNLNGLKKGNFLSKEGYQKLHFNTEGYGYGWANFKNKTISGHDGSAGTYYCHTIVIPHMNTAVIVMTNAAEEHQQKGIVALRERILKNIKRIINEV